MLKQLKYFQSVVQKNSFSEAAEENYVSQSAISQQIQALERELGFRLLDRKNRGFVLTPAGEHFYLFEYIITGKEEGGEYISDFRIRESRIFVRYFFK